MKYQILVIFLLLVCGTTDTFAAGLENRPIKITSNERFHFVNGSSIQFKFKPLSEQARALEITESASSLGVSYLGQIELKKNITALSALRSIADQIGDSLNISFGVIADSNTSEALKSNELLLLYHPAITITLALAKASEESHYEIICTYVLKDLKKVKENSQQATSEKEPPTAVAEDTAQTTEVREEDVANQ